MKEFGAMQASPFFDLWASAAIAEIISALYERRVVEGEVSGAPGVLTIEDPEDPRLADYREIRDAERRLRSGTFIAEGRLVVRRLLGAGRYRVRSALVTPPALHALGETLAAAGVPTYLVAQNIVEAVVGMEFHHGCLAAGERGPEPSADAVLAETRSPRLMVLEGLGDSSNVGALFRNALAFGVGAVFLAPGTADPLYRKAIRVSSGATVAMPFARLADWPRDLDRLRARRLHGAGADAPRGRHGHR